MFCSECGTKVKDNAKFCFNCGAKINEEQVELNPRIERKIEKKDISEEYIAQIRKKILESYLEGNIVSASSFYKRAQYYEMCEEEIDQIHNQTMILVQKLNSFISSLYEEGQAACLTEEQIEELEQLGNTYGIKSKLCHRFLEYYNEENEIMLKRKLIEEMLYDYAKTGKINNEFPEEFSSIKSVSAKEFFENYTEAICEASEIISEKYEDSKNGELDEKERKDLCGKIIKKGFIIDDLESLIEGYEKASGIYDKKILEKKKRVYEIIDELFGKKYKIWGDSVTWSGKYFLINEISRILEIAEEEFVDKYSDLEGLGSNNHSQIQELFYDYEENFYSNVEFVEKVLEIDISEETYEKVEEFLDEIVSALNETEQAFADIANREILEREERVRRKESRNRWSGGGFGVGGALKGAATAGAMNAVGGLLYSGANVVGNMMSGVSANRNRKKTEEEFENSVLSIMVKMTGMVFKEFLDQIRDNYPEIWFFPKIKDTNKEKNMREEFRQVDVETKKRIAIQLLIENPYNPLNGWTIFAAFLNECDKDTVGTFTEMLEEFEWAESLAKIIVDEMKKIDKALKEEKEDEFTASESIDILKEIILTEDVLIEYDIDINILSNDVEAKIKEIFAAATKKQEYIFHINNIKNMDIGQICDIGNNYFQDGEVIKARTIIVKRLGNDSAIDSILKNFWESKNENKYEAVRLLELYVNKREPQCKEALYVLSNVKDKAGKTLLVYAAEKNKKELVNELIKNGADVNILYTLLGKEINTDVNKMGRTMQTSINKEYAICGFCGKKISRTVKFCNYCGKKLNYKR